MKNGKCEMARGKWQMASADHLPFTISHFPFEMLFRALLLTILIPLSLQAQARIEGRVTNGTTQHPASNQKVLVLEPRQGMQQIADATTDANGNFSISQNGISAGSFYLLQA